MKKLELPYEIKPYRVNQEWGVYRPDIYEQFGFTRHNGVDIAPGERNEVRAPFDYVVQEHLNQPNGGGVVLAIVSLEEFEGPGAKPAYVQIDFMHLERPVVPVGHKGKAGDIVAIADNTGFSTGPHTHIRYKWKKRVASRLVDVEKNQAQNSFDPQPYRNKKFAADLNISKYQFTRDLFIGITGEDVRQLQRFLNTQGFRVALWGAGSPGNESTYFGSATQAALVRFQKARAINPASGYFGPITRGVVNPLL